MPVTYKTLFLLEADAAFLFEIKRLDVQSSNPADVYFWLYFDKASQQLHPLTFVSMSVEGEAQRREFGQGALWFGPERGTYTPHGPEPPLALRVLAAAALPTAAEAAMQAYFRRA